MMEQHLQRRSDGDVNNCHYISCGCEVAPATHAPPPPAFVLFAHDDLIGVQLRRPSRRLDDGPTPSPRFEMAGLLAAAFEYVHERSEKSALLHNLKRALLPVVLGSVVLSGLLFSSTVAYFIFYWSYIPSVGITRNIYLQFRCYIFHHSLSHPEPLPLIL